jgi:hypothetical protein
MCEQWQVVCRSGAYHVKVPDANNPDASVEASVGTTSCALTAIFAVIRAVDPAQLRTLKNRPRALKIRRSWLSRFSGNFLSEHAPWWQRLYGALRVVAVLLGAAVLSLVTIRRFSGYQRGLQYPSDNLLSHSWSVAEVVASERMRKIIDGEMALHKAADAATQQVRYD